MLETVYPWDNVGLNLLFPEDNPLMVVVKMGNVDCVRVLLSYKANVEGRIGRCCDSRYKSGIKGYLLCSNTPLFVAAECGHVGVMSCLVEHGANVDGGNVACCTPLMIAVKRKHERDVYKTWTRVYGPPMRTRSMDHLVDPVHGPPLRTVQ